MEPEQVTIASLFIFTLNTGFGKLLLSPIWSRICCLETDTQDLTEYFLQTRRRLTLRFHSHPAVHRAYEFISILFDTERISNICFIGMTDSPPHTPPHPPFVCSSEALTETSQAVVWNVSIKPLGSGCRQLNCDRLPENLLFLKQEKFRTPGAAAPLIPQPSSHAFHVPDREH